jgi:hypothetical protein
MSEQDPPDDLPDLLLPSILEDPYPDPVEDELQEATPTSALTAEADQSWQPSTADESALRRELAEVDALGPVSKAELRGLTGRIFDSLKDGVSYLSPFKPSPLYVEPIRAVNQQEWTKAVKQEPTKHSSSSQPFPSDPPSVSTKSKSHSSIASTTKSDLSPTSKLRSLIESMTESAISDRKLREAEAIESQARFAKLEEIVVGLAAATAQTVETAKMVNSTIASGALKTSPSNSTNSSHEGEIDEATRYGRILAAEAKKGLSLDSKFDGSPKNRHIFVNKLSARSSEVSWSHPHHDIVSYEIPFAGNVKMINLLANHGGLSIELVVQASKSWSAPQVQRAKHMYRCLHDSLSDATVLQLSKYQPDFEGNGPVLFMYIMTKLAKPTLSIQEEQKLKRGLSEDVLRKKIQEFNYDVSKLETYVVDLQLEIAQWNSQATYPDLEHILLKALGAVKSSLFLFDVRTLNKEHTKRLKQYDIDGIESNKMTSTEILSTARNDYLEHVADGTWKLDILEQEESRVTFVNATKKLEEQWHSTTNPKRQNDPQRPPFKPDANFVANDPNKAPHWRNVPPQSGEPHTRDHKNGRTGEASKIHWCANCGGPSQPGRWNSTHVTQDHNSDFYKDQQGGDATNRGRSTVRENTSGASTATNPVASDLRMSATLIAQLAEQQGRHDDPAEEQE